MTPGNHVDNATIEVAAVTIDKIIALRHEMLRPGLPRETAEFDGDDDADTLHFGAFTPDGGNVGCASYMRSPWEGRPAYQLRGMATASTWRGRGVGRRMLAAAEAHMLEHTEIRQHWCNARIVAVDFYLKHGWSVASEEFVIPTVGPHRKMTRTIGELSDRDRSFTGA